MIEFLTDKSAELKALFDAALAADSLAVFPIAFLAGFFLGIIDNLFGALLCLSYEFRTLGFGSCQFLGSRVIGLLKLSFSMLGALQPF